MAYTVQVPASDAPASDTSQKTGTEAREEVVQRIESNEGVIGQEAEQVRRVVAF